MSPARPRLPATLLALLALAAGLAGGALLHALDPALALRIARLAEPAGMLWTNALRMIVIPLVVTMLVVGIAGHDAVREVGRLGGLSFALFVALLALAAALTLLATPALLRWFRVDAATVAALGRHAAAAPAPAGRASAIDWLLGLVPVNPFRSATSDDILPLLVFTALFAAAVNAIPAGSRTLLVGVFRALSEAMLVMMRWILRLMPAGILCLTFVLAARAGAASIGALGYFVVLESALLFGFTLVLYPIAARGRAGLRRFAWAALPAQMVAVGTRSSLASLPAMIEGAEERLELPRHVSSLVLPLAASTFKVNRAISSTVQLLFLARLYGIHLEPLQIATFLATVGMTSFSTPGIPSTGSHASLPAYLAVGIPIEGVLILGAVDAIPDIFKTLVNVTGDLAAAAVVARLAPGPEARAGAGAPAAVEARG